MKIGMIGLGKLGKVVALAINRSGHEVMGFDIDPDKMQKEVFKATEVDPLGGRDIETYFRESTLQFGTVTDVVAFADIVFVSVQTPHEPEYEGITRLPKKRVDFDYHYLVTAVKEVEAAAEFHKKQIILAVISTVLPGTMRREVIPLLKSGFITLVYNPSFIAMGTTYTDFIHPEFVLIGCDDKEAGDTLEDFYRTVVIPQHTPVARMSIESSELTKVSYNTYISLKIAFVNTLMEICDKIPGANVDDVTDALALGTRRLMSPMYMRGGMGDGGSCHPRDNIAMSWLARKLMLRFDLFEAAMMAREKQAEGLCAMVDMYSLREAGGRKPVYILGTAYKKNIGLEQGSPALLCAEILHERGIDVTLIDPYVGRTAPVVREGVYLIGMNHYEFPGVIFPNGSVVIDPWGYIPDREGVKVIRVGRRT